MRNENTIPWVVFVVASRVCDLSFCHCVMWNGTVNHYSVMPDAQITHILLYPTNIDSFLLSTSLGILTTYIIFVDSLFESIVKLVWNSLALIFCKQKII